MFLHCEQKHLWANSGEIEANIHNAHLLITNNKLMDGQIWIEERGERESGEGGSDDGEESVGGLMC